MRWRSCWSMPATCFICIRCMRLWLPTMLRACGCLKRQVSAMRALCTTGFCVPTADMSTLCRCSLLLTDGLFLRVWKKSCHDAEQRRERTYKEYILHTCAVGKPSEESRTNTAESEHQSEKHP